MAITGFYENCLHLEKDLTEASNQDETYQRLLLLAAA